MNSKKDLYPGRCEICDQMDSRGSFCRCKLSKRRIDDIRFKPIWCEKKEPEKLSFLETVKDFIYGTDK